MAEKLFDSELKVMGVLWREGDTTAKHIADVLIEQVGWNRNTTYTLIKGPSPGKNPISCAMRWWKRRLSRRRRPTS